MSGLRFAFAGEELVADLSGALYWPAQETLAVSDLHLEKGSSGAAAGHLLPPFDSRATLDRLADAIARFRPRRVICLGDSFHDDAGPGRLVPADAARVRALTGAVEWIWIAGNHDPAPPAALGGAAASGIEIGRLAFRHQARPGAAPGEVSGHFHPRATVPTRGRRVRGHCFATDPARLILPAAGAYAGGLDVLDPAIADLLAWPFDVLLIGRARLHRVTSARLVGTVRRSDPPDAPRRASGRSSRTGNPRAVPGGPPPPPPRR